MMDLQRFPAWLLEEDSFSVTYVKRRKPQIAVTVRSSTDRLITFEGHGHSIAEAAKKARAARENME